MRRIAPGHFVLAWLAFRAVAWTALLYFTQPTLPLDVLEHLAWGREWRLVYAHHPGLPAWINEGINLAAGGSRLALSATAPMATSIAMAAVWLLARRITDDRRAAVAALSLEGAWYFNVAAIEFNHNISQLAVCAWMFFLTHRAFLADGDGREKSERLAWPALGAVAALSLYAKHSSALFLAAALAWSVWDSRARKKWATSGPWLSLLVFAGLTMPQILALVDLRFAPMEFALGRAGTAEKWTHHLAHPLRFASAQLAAVLPALILILLAREGKDDNSFHASASDVSFVRMAALAPLALALSISAVGGWRFQSMWGASMVSFIPLWALLCIPPGGLNWRRWRIGTVAVASLAALAVAAINIGGPYWNGRGKRVHYPAEKIAEHVESEWRARFPDSPLRFAAGPKHMSSLVSFYAPSRPSAILDGDWEDAFWASPDEFIEHGGAIVWAVRDGKQDNIPPPDFANDYPLATRLPDFSVEWKTSANIPPMKVGVLLVPPQDAD